MAKELESLEQGEPKKKKLLSMPVLLLIGVVALLGLLAAAQVTGAVDLTELARKIPGMDKVLPASSSKGSAKSLEEVEIEKLKGEKAELQKRLEELQMNVDYGAQQEAKFNQVKAELEKQVNDLKEQTAKLEGLKTDAKEWASRISTIKAPAIVKIFDELSDDKIISMLNELDSDVSAKVIAAMDPARAARLMEPALKEQQEITQKNQLTKQNYQSLAQSLAAMKAEEASAILGALPDGMAAGILKEMSQDGSAKILGTLDPYRAAEIVKLMAAME